MSSKNFRERIRKSIADKNLQLALEGNAIRRRISRLEAFSLLHDYQQRRSRTHAIKVEVISHLDEYLNLFITRLSENGIKVHRASNGDEALKIFFEIAKNHNAHLVAKSKSMVSEEINFNHALEGLGIQAVETDLGEYIVQLRGERPSHIITPAVHLRRNEVGRLFQEKFGTPYTEDIPEIVAMARRIMRDIFTSADIGVSGVNFGVADTGTLCIVTNEGNGRMVTTLPPVHVALMGIERVIPTLDDLALFLSVLPRSATGQKLSVYTSLIHSPKKPSDADGPVERHLILLDNGRLAIRNSPLSESLLCIRCGACLNVCPVFRTIGGHAYLGRDGTIAPYPGPIGSVISPGLLGSVNFGQLSQASSLCGACKEVCPVDINLPELLLRVRAGEVNEKTKSKKQNDGIGLPIILKYVLMAYSFIAANSLLFSLSIRIGGVLSHIFSPKNVYMHIPSWTGWGYSKDFPRFAMKPFRARWKSLSQRINKVAIAPGQSTKENITKQAIHTLSLVEQFSAEFSAVGGKVYRVHEKDVNHKISELLKEFGVERVCVDCIGEKYTTGIPHSYTPDPMVQVGITGALIGIAESGSLLQIGGPARPLTISLLPDIHIAILKETDIVRSLAQAFQRSEVREASAAVIITGPSRTADIEMTLTIGVHGPKEVHLLLVGGEKEI